MGILESAIGKAPIISRLLSKKGQFASVRIMRPGKLRKAYRSENVQKVLVGIVRCGLDYSAQARVKDLRRMGELPTTPQPLPWGVWVKFPYVIVHKEAIYLRLYPLFSKWGKIRLRVFWFHNGKRVSKVEIAHMLLSSEFSDDTTPPSCLTVKAENVKSLR